MLSDYLKNLLDIRVFMYSPVIEGELVFKFLIDFVNLGDSPIDLEVKLSIWESPNSTDLVRSLIEEVSALSPGGTRTITVVLDRGESGKGATLDEIRFNGTNPELQDDIILPRLSLWNLAVHELSRSTRR